jgi:hypothetical protein
MTRIKTSLLMIAAIFAMAVTTYAQNFTPNANGEVSAIDANVRSLMEQADKVIADTAQDRLAADKKLTEAVEQLRKVVANEKAEFVSIFNAIDNCVNAVLTVSRSRRTSDAALHKAAMAYFANVIAINKAGYQLAASNYGEWQSKVLPTMSLNVPPDYKSLLEAANKALVATREREDKYFRQLMADFEELSKEGPQIREKK